MKREIKFRAWHPGDKVMVYDLNSLKLFHGVLQQDDYEVMQFTRLQDKNGKDIYEGDIIERVDFYPPGYDHEQSRFILVAEIDAYYLHLLGDPLIEIEILGNIYENPEILNNETRK